MIQELMLEAAHNKSAPNSSFALKYSL